MSLENEQLSFDSEQKENKRVTVLGMEFENDDARREYFREELRKKLPELRKIEGFPIGEEEDIIALSDPPFYTACPNPFLNDFIEFWSKKTDLNEYHTESFASDVSIGKNDPIYTAHTYHTKVPYQAIMRYILHYTKPGDIILDRFCGTGMTGVAASMCANKNIVQNIYLGATEADIGARKAIIGDLSVVASYIAHSYTTPTDECNLLTTMNEVISQSFKSYSWMYETMVDGEAKLINYVVWSDVLVCPNCQSEFPFYEVAYDPISNSVLKDFSCPSCRAQLTKEKSERLFESLYDEVLKKNVRLGKQVPVAINYISGKAKKMKKIDQHDLDLIKRINQTKLIHWVPSSRIPEGVNTRQPRISHGINYVHQFYTKRNLIILSDLYNRISKLPEDVRVTAYLSLQSIVYTLTSKLVRYNLGNRGNGILNGTLYIPSLVAESNVYKILEGKVKDISKAMVVKERDVISSVESATNSRISANSIDYIFTDPPFGANINYSELNFIWEDWLKVKTETTDEAIINQIQKKDLFDYQRLMEDSFSSYYYVLKPNRWITVEFSNSKASVWNSIQEAMQKAGFIIANVSALDKKQGSFKAVTSTTAVKQDLVISAYKPSEENIEKMKAQRNNVESAWTFVTQHLSNLPVFMGDKGDAIIISERTPRILFDRMVAYHVQQGLPVPISSADFQSGVASRYLMRDGMAFLDSQVAEYDKKRILAREFAQLSLFVSDENSAIEWIRQQLMKKPQSRQDIHPHFMKEIQHIAKYEELPELDELLAQNFLYYDGNGAVPNQISTYLTKNYHELRGLEKSDALSREKAKNRWYVPNPNQQADLEKLREKNLLREFSHYLDEINNSKKKLKVFRTEAIRVGFKKAWTEKEYQTIVTVGERLPEKVIQEDDKLLMYYDNALMRIEM